LTFTKKNTKGYLSSKDIASLKEMRTITTNHDYGPLYGDTWPIFKILFLKDRRFVTCSHDKTIRNWNLDQNIPEIILKGHTDRVCDVITLKSGKLCSCSWDRTIKIWDIEKATCEKTLLGHSGQVYALVQLSNNFLISGGRDQILFWNLKATNNNACIRILPNKGFCTSIIVVSNEEMVCPSDENINIFRIYGCNIPLKKLTGHTDNIADLLLHADGQSFLSSSYDKTMRMWNVQSGSCIRTFHGNSECNGMVWFQTNIVATGYNNGEIKLWNVYSGECVRTLQSQQNGVVKLIVDSDGVLISSGYAKTLTLFG